MTKNGIICTSSNFDKIIDLISQYFFGSQITLTPVNEYINENIWYVSNSKGLIEGYKVTLVKGKFRFIEL